jgi:cobalt-zinc-cadmium efflux system outer membrane protein
VITQTDLFRTELLASKYELQYRTARQEVSNRQKELRFLMGVTDSVAIDLNENFSPNVILNMDSLLNQAIQNRSDVQAIQAGISVANSNINLQKSLAIPQPEIGVIFNPQNGIPYLGFYGTIKLPFFDRNQGQINQAFVLKTQSEQQLLAVRTQIQTEITTAFNRYQLQRQNVQQFETILIQSRTILDNVQYAYLRGGTTIIDFLEAQRSWLETQQQYYDALQSYRQSYIQLLYSTGLINQLAQ